MSLMFISSFNGPEGDCIEPLPSGGKRALLAAVGQRLLFPAHFQDDNLDSFFDCLTDAKGTVVLRNASLWWRLDPQLMGQLSQCFIDVTNGPALWCVTEPLLD
jgi:hypothetical protein